MKGLSAKAERRTRQGRGVWYGIVETVMGYWWDFVLRQPLVVHTAVAGKAPGGMAVKPEVRERAETVTI